MPCRVIQSYPTHKQAIENDRANVTFLASRNPFTHIMPTEDIPQFITITFDDGITPYSAHLIKRIANTTDPHTGCLLKMTFYISIDGTDANPNTKCNYVNAIHKTGAEIATHTLRHTAHPTAAEIMGAVDFLNETCGIPRDEIRGFRTPFLDWQDDTLQHLYDNGFLYDSSIVSTDHEAASYGSNHLFPFTFEQASIDVFATSKPDVTIQEKRGLWEIHKCGPWTIKVRMTATTATCLPP